MSKILTSKGAHWTIATITLIALACTSAEARVKRSFFNKSVKSDVSTSIYKNDEINQDCTLAHLKAKIWTYPEHGTLELSKGTVANTYNKAMLQSKCSRTVPNGIKAFYRPSAGYKGKDEAVFYATDPAGNETFTTIYLTVR